MMDTHNRPGLGSSTSSSSASPSAKLTLFLTSSGGQPSPGACPAMLTPEQEVTPWLFILGLEGLWHWILFVQVTAADNDSVW